MGYVFSYQDAVNFEKLLLDPSNKDITDIQNKLMADMLKPVRGQRLLGVGCGTGMNLTPLIEIGLQVSGIDPSPYMLDIAKKYLGHRVDLHRGFGEDLPFEDNSFNYVSLNSSLEYVENPLKVLEEACRVAKDKLFLSVMNKYTLKRIPMKMKGISNDPIYSEAKFFSIWELSRIVRKVSGDVPLSWKTASRMPRNSGRIVNRIEQSRLISWYPFGAYIGLMAVLIPKYRTRPLTVAYSAKS